MCDATGCVSPVAAWRIGRDNRGHKTTLALCVAHRQALDSGEPVTTAAGTFRE